MRRGTRLAWLLAAVGACAIGCKGSGPRKKGPEDPLLQSKTPVQSKFAEPNEAAARADPSPPTLPAGAWAVNPGQPASSVRLGPPDFNIPPGQASLAWSTDKPAVSTAGPYARSADYRWLQGVVERTPDNRCLVRYEPMSRASSAGKVFVEGHERLDLFEPGDVIRVEGTLVEEPQTGSERLPHPRYQVRHVELIQRHS